MTAAPPERPLDTATERRILVPFACVTMIWGSTWLVIHTQLGIVPPMWSVAYRFSLGALAMFAVAVATRQRLAIGRGAQAIAAVVGLLTFALNYNSVYAAEGHVPSGLVAVMFALLVPCNALLARIFLGQLLSRQFLIGSGVAMSGVALLFVHELRGGGMDAHQTAIGLGFAALALVGASIGNVLQGSARARAAPMASLLAWSMAWGAGLDAVLAWAVTGPPRFDGSLSYVAGLLYLAIVASAVAFSLYFNLIRTIGPARSGYINVLVPVIAMLLSTLFERYVWSVEAAAGGGLVLVGLVVAMRARSPAR